MWYPLPGALPASLAHLFVHLSASSPKGLPHISRKWALSFSFLAVFSYILSTITDYLLAWFFVVVVVRLFCLFVCFCLLH